MRGKRPLVFKRKKKKVPVFQSDTFCSYGAPGPIRTADTRFRRAVLYPLSYGGVGLLF